jgi:hypothetical protein
MPARHVTWSCDRCHNRFSSYDDASQCEIDHIARDAIASSQAKIAEIFEDRFGRGSALRPGFYEDDME